MQLPQPPLPDPNHAAEMRIALQQRIGAGALLGIERAEHEFGRDCADVHVLIDCGIVGGSGAAEDVMARSVAARGPAGSGLVADFFVHDVRHCSISDRLLRNAVLSSAPGMSSFSAS